MAEATSKYLDQTRGEEIANSISHGVGAILSLTGLVVLIIYAGKTADSLKATSLVIFGISLTLLYLMSLFSHALTHPKVKKFFQIMDYSSIFVLIAGSYTPILVNILREGQGMTVLAVVWGIAIGGVLFKIFLIGKYEFISMVLYLSMGWLAVFFISDFIRKVPLDFLLWIFAGGISYTVGTIFYLATKMRYHHFVWHIFVLIGGFCHYIAILTYIALK